MDNHNRHQPGDPMPGFRGYAIVASVIILGVAGTLIWAIVKIVNHFT